MQQVGHVHDLEIGAGAIQQPEACTRQALSEQVTLSLIEGGQVQVVARILRVAFQMLQVVGQAGLHGSVDGEDVELMNLAEFRRQCGRGGHGAHLPAGDVKGLAEAGDDQAAGGQLRIPGDALVRLAVKDHVLVHLVAEQQYVGGGQQRLQLLHLLGRPDRAAGVVRRVDDEQPGAGREGGGNALKVRREAAGLQRHAHGDGASHADGRHVAVVARVQHDDLIARPGDGQNGGEQGLGGPGGEGDLGVGIVGVTVAGRDLAGNGLTQGRPAGHGRVLVVAGAHGAADGFDQGRIAVEVRKALTQIDGTVLCGQGRHGAEDGGADIRQAAGKGHGHGVSAMGIGVLQAFAA